MASGVSLDAPASDDDWRIQKGGSVVFPLRAALRFDQPFLPSPWLQALAVIDGSEPM